MVVAAMVKVKKTTTKKSRRKSKAKANDNALRRGPIGASGIERDPDTGEPYVAWFKDDALHDYIRMCINSGLPKGVVKDHCRGWAMRKYPARRIPSWSILDKLYHKLRTEMADAPEPTLDMGRIKIATTERLLAVIMDTSTRDGDIVSAYRELGRMWGWDVSSRAVSELTPEECAARVMAWQQQHQEQVRIDDGDEDD